MKANDRKKVVIRAAVALFAARGFEMTSMDDVAAAARVTKPIIYRHFRSKRALYLELLETVGTDLIEQLAHATEGVESPRERLRAGVVAFFAFVESQPAAYLLLFGPRGQRDTEFDGVVDQVQMTIADLVASRVTGVIDDDYRRFVSFAVVGLAQGAARSYLQEAQALEGHARTELAERRAHETTELLWSGMRNIPG
jgi:AcrR family transcriptional regulator